MRLTPTLSTYLGWHFLVAFGAVLCVVMGLIVLFDVIELMRRTAHLEDLGFSTLMGLSLLKMPRTLQDALPFIVLIGMMLALWRLARSHELVVIRSAGVSVWQMLMPTLGLVVIMGFLNLAIVNPFSTSLFQNFENLENELILRRPQSFDLSSGGMWLRDNQDDGLLVVNARTVKQDNESLTLDEITIWRFRSNGDFETRFDASNGELLTGFFHLTQAWELAPGVPAERHAEYFVPTDITLDRIKENFAAPETISFWELPSFIAFYEASGFSAISHRLYLQSLIASPFMWCAMVLLASAFYLTTNNRLGGWTMRAIGCVGVGFFIYFFTRLTFALGLSATLPVPLAAWAPALVAGLLGLGYLFHREDG